VADLSNGKAAVLQVSSPLSVETVKFPSELAEGFALHLMCDADGNYYVRTNPEGNEGIRKLSPKGERVALFQAKSTDVKVNRAGYFSVAPDGNVYQLVHA
jgi:hypothetical protein